MHWMHFDDTAIDVNDELPIFIEKIQKTYSVLGYKIKKIYSVENHKYKK